MALNEKNSMRFYLDIGNSRTKLAFFKHQVNVNDNNNLNADDPYQRKTVYIENKPKYNTKAEKKEIKKEIKKDFKKNIKKDAKRDIKKIQHFIKSILKDKSKTNKLEPSQTSTIHFYVASVNPQACRKLKSRLKKMSKQLGFKKIEWRQLDYEQSAFAAKRMKDASTMGADRLANLWAACGRSHHENAKTGNKKKKAHDVFDMRKSSSAVIVDFGTASTVTAKYNGQQLAGGIIAPGLSMLARSLSFGKQLFEVKWPQKTNLLGTDTEQSLQAGLQLTYAASCLAIIGKAQLIHAKINKNQKTKKKIIYVTGGRWPLAAKMVLQSRKSQKEAQLSLKNTSFSYCYIEDSVIIGLKHWSDYKHPLDREK